MDKQYNYIFFSTNKISDLKMELIGYRITSHAFQLANSIKHDRFLIGGHGLACKVDKPHAINNTSLVLGRNLDYLDLNDTSEVIDLPENNIFSPLKYSQNLINQQDSYTFKDILNKCDVTLDCTPEFEQKTCKSFEYVTSMYCSNKCIFCLNSSHMKLLNTCKNGLITDKRDFDLSCQQIQQYYDAGYNFMLCLDPSINSNLQYLEYLCNYIVKNNLDLKWLCGLNLRNISTHVTDMISEAGCILASIGVETATSNERLEYIGKGFTLEKAAEHLAYLSSKGIFNIINIILGIPNFEKDELKYMRQFIKDSGGRDIFNIIYYYPYVLYPSELSYNVKKKHKIMSIPNTYIFKIPGKTFDETMNLVCEDSFSSSDNVSYLYNVLRPTFFIQYNLIYVLHKYYNGNIKLIMEKLRSSYPDMNFNQL
jgi:Fe-S oxidoreductase